MTKVVNLFLTKKSVWIFLSVAVFATFLFAIPLHRILKRDAEIERIIEKDYSFDQCVQYALIATRNGWYPCFNCSDGKIYLSIGEVWKYGKTCIGELKRYAQGLPYKNLKFEPQYYGTEKECLIEEKTKIYEYPNLPECQKRSIKLMRPPGNKIDR